jgi:hypothetical protein
MLRFRHFLLWLLMAALPLQGMAAASMLFCGSQAAARAVHAASAQGHLGHHSPMQPAHDHASHGHETHHDVQNQAAAGIDPLSDVFLDDGSMQSHACPVCAVCSQSHAVGGFDSLPLASTGPFAEPWQPQVRLSSRTLTLPDKPPRG